MFEQVSPYSQQDHAGGEIIMRPDRFNPYVFHHGTMIVCRGPNFAVIGADTRLASDYSIETRKKSRIFKLAPKIMFSATGFSGDIDAFVSYLKNDMVTYQSNNFKPMSVSSLAKNISNKLYYRRGFPYYVMATVCGINDEGKAEVYHFDPLGGMYPTLYDASGSGSKYAIPILDNFYGNVHRNTTPEEVYMRHDLETIKELVRDAMCSVAEVDIGTGDYLEIATVNENGITIEEFDLPKH